MSFYGETAVEVLNKIMIDYCKISLRFRYRSQERQQKKFQEEGERATKKYRKIAKKKRTDAHDRSLIEPFAKESSNDVFTALSFRAK